MKTIEKPVFDQHQVALELGYSEKEIEDFTNLRKVINFWSDELEDGHCKSSDFPHIEAIKMKNLGNYANKIMKKKMEFYQKYKHLLLNDVA